MLPFCRTLIFVAVPIIVDSRMEAVDCLWNHDGTVLAICGVAAGADAFNQIAFYSAYGNHLRSLKIPGREVTALAWEGQSLRIALAVDSFIYFANIRPDYVWCYFNRTVAFLSHADFKKDGQTIFFWDTITNQSYTKLVDVALGLVSNGVGDHCCIAVESFNVAGVTDPNIVIETNSKEKKYQLLVCNSIGTTVDCKEIFITF